MAEWKPWYLVANLCHQLSGLRDCRQLMSSWPTSNWSVNYRFRWLVATIAIDTDWCSSRSYLDTIQWISNKLSATVDYQYIGLYPDAFYTKTVSIVWNPYHPGLTANALQSPEDFWLIIFKLLISFNLARWTSYCNLMTDPIRDPIEFIPRSYRDFIETLSRPYRGSMIIVWRLRLIGFHERFKSFTEVQNLCVGPELVRARISLSLSLSL